MMYLIEILVITKSKAFDQYNQYIVFSVGFQFCDSFLFLKLKKKIMTDYIISVGEFRKDQCQILRIWS